MFNYSFVLKFSDTEFIYGVLKMLHFVENGLKMSKWIFGFRITIQHETESAKTPQAGNIPDPKVEDDNVSAPPSTPMANKKNIAKTTQNDLMELICNVAREKVNIVTSNNIHKV